METLIIAMNFSDISNEIHIPVESLLKDGTELRSLLNHERYGVKEGYLAIKLEGWSGVWLG